MSNDFCLASPGDGKRILEILESAPAKGSIELLYTRRPDAYLSYQKESDAAFVYVAKDDGEIVGTVAEIVRQVYIGGEIKKAAYICGLKKDVLYPHAVNWGKAFFRGMVKEDIDCYLCSVVSDNHTMRDIFSKRRKKTATVTPLQKYTTYMMAPYFKFKLKDRDCTFRQATPADEPALLAFLNSEGCKKDLFPVIRRLDQFTDLHTEDFYMLENADGILAAGALWNQSGYRQYIVKKYKGMMKLARCLNPILSLLGYIRLPKENESINFPMLSFLLAKGDSEEYYKAFLNGITAEIKKHYGMFVIGTVESHFANRIFKQLRSISFQTEIYGIEFMMGNKAPKLRQDSLFLECGLL